MPMRVMHFDLGDFLWPSLATVASGLGANRPDLRNCVSKCPLSTSLKSIQVELSQLC